MIGFEYIEPSNVSEAISLLARHKEDAKVIAGGTDLIVGMNKSHITPKYLVSLNNISNLDYIEYHQEQGLKIGALTTISTLQKSSKLSEKYSIIQQAACQFANIAIRNVATLGGNICNAAPSADMVPCLIALAAKAKIAGASGERIVPLEDFFIGAKKTVLKADEILVEIQVPEPPANTRGVYIKYAIRGSADLPVVGVAVVATLEPKEKICKDIKIVLSNVASTPIRARNAEDTLIGRRVDEDIIENCAQSAFEVANPRPGSIRASAEYKKSMVKVFIKKAMKEVTILE